MFILGVLIVAGIGAYVTISLLSWHSIRSQTDHLHQISNSIHDTRNSSLSTTALLDTVHQKLAQSLDTSPCNVSHTVLWQQSFVGFGKILDECRSARQALEAQQKMVADFRSYREGDHAIAHVVQEAVDALAKTPDDYTMAKQTWQEARKRISSIKNTFTEDIAHALISKIDTVVSSLDSIQVANQAKNRAAFDKAQNSVQAAYKELALLGGYARKGYEGAADDFLRALESVENR